MVSEFTFAVPLAAILEIAPLFIFRAARLFSHFTLRCCFFSPAEIRFPGYRFVFIDVNFVLDGPLQLHDYDRMRARLRHTPQKRCRRRRRSTKHLAPLAMTAFLAPQDWKMRKSAYQQVQALFQQAQSPDDEVFDNYGERLLLMSRPVEWYASGYTCCLGVDHSVAIPTARAHPSWAYCLCRLLVRSSTSCAKACIGSSLSNVNFCHPKCDTGARRLLYSRHEAERHFLAQTWPCWRFH